ncbi:cob(I)yrinic acid a,c-diamide adenosyltransferase [Microaerobacter geothermalis]|uniref:cob(I)yrinic acid a,c-diamide adenosyltransferase n=1 Tax=Microaerobacter geothermalis TaxID=674972 RepID=UPI001F36E33F|nr:cob(I)yrinic acid a,c-diamide adenosyltransferase [Microaerobacter geothermalis]MCF6093669.1 cob(I)yrinic acid a,c-diamide adenosyltransferase [Microaerobacter geothermalis]
MKIYTKTGDSGKTSLIGGRVDKDHLRVEAYGTVDELCSYVGEAITRLNPEKDQDVIAELTEIQLELFDAGADLANWKKVRDCKINQEMIERLEQWIDRHLDSAPEVKKFILPGGHPTSSMIHICRTVTRRAERRVVSLAKVEAINEEVRKYLNRLSDYFFALARAMNARNQVGDILYDRGRDVFR